MAAASYPGTVAAVRTGRASARRTPCPTPPVRYRPVVPRCERTRAPPATTYRPGATAYRAGGFEVLLASLRIDGVAEPVTFWRSTVQFGRRWHAHLTIDVVPGRGSGSSWKRQFVSPRLIHRDPQTSLAPKS
jgi:uncharacterized protein (DUF779 family)